MSDKWEVSLSLNYYYLILNTIVFSSPILLFKLICLLPWFTMNYCILGKPEVTSDSGSAFNFFFFFLVCFNHT